MYQAIFKGSLANAPECVVKIIDLILMQFHHHLLDALRRHQSETAAALEALMPAVLERAFRGEL